MTASIEVGAMYRRLFFAAIVTASAATAGVWFYYRGSESLSGLLVWFAATLLIPLALAWAGYWLAMRLFGDPRRAFLWALGLMIAVTLIMLLAEWTVTRIEPFVEPPIPRVAA
jgi:membrane protease YdiL (CAAX protease family)